jgi:hypothetical protein
VCVAAATRSRGPREADVAVVLVVENRQRRTRVSLTSRMSHNSRPVVNDPLPPVPIGEHGQQLRWRECLIVPVPLRRGGMAYDPNP